MTLLDQEVKKQEPKGKKIVLILLILSIFTLIMLVVMMMALEGKQTKDLVVALNGNNLAMDSGLITTDENGTNYISIQKIAKAAGYDYLTGEYKQYNEDSTNTKCYLENANEVIQFEANNNIIYKINHESILDKAEYKLNNKILKVNNLLYIALEDINIGLNVIYKYSQEENKIILNTVDNLSQTYNTSLPQETNNEYITISDSFNNKKTIAYNMLVVANQNQKWGVINATDFSTVIGNKYTSLEFIESAGVFIASDDNKYGVISKATNQAPIISLRYEEVSVVSNKPLCYQVKLAGKYGIINEKGTPIINNDYESTGYKAQTAMEESVLTIPELGKDKQTALVVNKEGLYGLVSLDNGSIIVDCVLEKVYIKNEQNKKVYYVQIQGQEIELNKYLEYINYL